MHLQEHNEILQEFQNVQLELLLCQGLHRNANMTIQGAALPHLPHLVVDAWAMIFPPIGFLGSAANMAAPST